MTDEPMFKSKHEGGEAGDTVIAAGVKVEGDFTSEGNILIEGEVKGNIRTTLDLQVGERAKITADISAGTARIAGEIRGNVTVRDRLELTQSSRVFGDIHAKVVIVEAGAVLNGHVVMEGSETGAPQETRLHGQRPTRIAAMAQRGMKNEDSSGT